VPCHNQVDDEKKKKTRKAAKKIACAACTKDKVHCTLLAPKERRVGKSSKTVVDDADVIEIDDYDEPSTSHLRLAHPIRSAVAEADANRRWNAEMDLRREELRVQREHVAAVNRWGERITVALWGMYAERDKNIDSEGWKYYSDDAVAPEAADDDSEEDESGEEEETMRE
jgi:hypothetical protein